MMTPKLILRDKNPQLVEAWKRAFSDVPEVEVGCGHIFDVPAYAIVSPANSFGFMDGGIDAVYSARFGWGLSETLQKIIFEEHYGELPVGEATSLDIEPEDPNYTVLICAPTMRVPMDIRGTVNAYLAMRAVLIESLTGCFESVLCPGLGTAVGKLEPEIAAYQMREAYRVVIQNQPLQFEDIEESWRYNESLRRGVEYQWGDDRKAPVNE